jgi:mono/diheme cytochrome c family protein
MKPWVLLIVVLLAAAVALVVAFTQVKLDAIHKPGRFETFLATGAKRILIYISSRSGIPPPPADLEAAAKEGDTIFGTDCSMCHGADGHTPTDTGRWMYPRASDLTSKAVQQYSDPELFWIIKNGIRLSGMPAFGKVEADEHIWYLVDYLRTLRSNIQPKTESGSQ